MIISRPDSGKPPQLLANNKFKDTSIDLHRLTARIQDKKTALIRRNNGESYDSCQTKKKIEQKKIGEQFMVYLYKIYGYKMHALLRGNNSKGSISRKGCYLFCCAPRWRARPRKLPPHTHARICACPRPATQRNAAQRNATQCSAARNTGLTGIKALSLQVGVALTGTSVRTYTHPRVHARKVRGEARTVDGL